MKTIKLTQATDSLAEYVQKVSKEPIIVMADGKPVAAVVAIENTDRETASLSTNPQFLTIIDRSRIRQQKEGGITSEEMRRRLQLN